MSRVLIGPFPHTQKKKKNQQLLHVGYWLVAHQLDSDLRSTLNFWLEMPLSVLHSKQDLYNLETLIH